MSIAALDPVRLKFEPGGADFPYYADSPPTISGTGWLFVLAGTMVGFVALVTSPSVEDGGLSDWLRVVMFVTLPLLTLAIAAPGRWKEIFRRVGRHEIILMFGFAVLNIIISMSVGALFQSFGSVAHNAGIASATALEGFGLVSFFGKVSLQLLGEELITILPFLALLWYLHAKVGLRRNSAVLAAWLLSAIIFGLLHLPAYDWNIMQCLIVIGSARVVLTLAYVWTKNIWVSTGAHIINDWAILGSTVFLTPLVVTT